MPQEDGFKVLVAHCKEYGFIFPSSEIYDGLSAVYDYGQNGVELKNNVRRYWWEAMTRMHDNIVGLDAAIFMHPKVWEASGHLKAFNDPLIDNRDSKKRYRADVLVEEWIGKQEEKIEKEVAKAAKRFGDSFDRGQFVSTNARVLGYQQAIDMTKARMAKCLVDNDLDGLRQLIIDLEIACPISGTRNWTEVRQFNLMFATKLGSVSDDASEIYLRPETAQGIFVNYLNVQKTSRRRLPFGIAQTGKAFRNEIVARQFTFRMREFEQMEMQFFVKPGEEMRWFEYWKEQRMRWHLAMGLGAENYRWHPHEKLAHYANAAVDIEYRYPIGFKEVEGIHSRTDFDLSSHEKLSGRKIQYYDPEENRSYTPYVVETSIGLDRCVLMLLAGSLREEQVSGDDGDGEVRKVLSLPTQLAPMKVAILPLVRKDGMPERARAILDDLKWSMACDYEEKDTIGKRYRRQDAIGTPFCVTVDTQTLEDGTVTVRERDTMSQERVSASSLKEYLGDRVLLEGLLKKI